MPRAGQAAVTEIARAEWTQQVRADGRMGKQLSIVISKLILAASQLEAYGIAISQSPDKSVAIAESNGL